MEIESTISRVDGVIRAFIMPDAAAPRQRAQGNTASKSPCGLRKRDKPERGLCYDSKRALRADYKPCKVIPDDPLGASGAGVDYLSGAQHDLKTEHIVPRNAVFDGAGPPAHSAIFPPMVEKLRLVGSGG